MEKHDTTVEDALRAGTFDSLAIKRIDGQCYLVVTIAGATRVLTNPRGSHLTFRHAWQVREWLQQKFQITTETIPVETYW